LNVLEHIQDDRKALAHMFNILRPGGKVCVIVPAYEALRGPIDNALGHYRRYTVGTIREISLSAGFLIADQHYMNVVGFFGWWLNARVFKRTKQSPLQVRMFDRFIVPALLRMERMVPPPFGQNIFAVLEKPAAATA
jgi:SAM-dependent methyltransferase